MILAILGSVGHSNVQNCWCSDSSRNLGKIKFTSSKAHLLRLENLLQVIRKCCSSSMNGGAVEVGPEHGDKKFFKTSIMIMSINVEKH